MQLVTSDQYCVSVVTVVGGFEDYALPVPRPEMNLVRLLDAKGSFVVWPRVWVRLPGEVLRFFKITFYAS